MTNFATLNNLTEIVLEFVTTASLSIRAGDQPQEITDAPVIKIGGKPVLPGSSLKGALRSSLEGLLAARGVSVCVPATAIPNEIKREKREQQYLEKIGRKKPCEPQDKDLCPVCLIFGTAGQKSGLSGSAIFLDATLTGEVSPETLLERTHVAITRDTRSQAGGALVTVESVDAGAKFVGSVRLINPEDWQVGAILQAIEWLKQLGIGSKKTAGYGQLNIAVQSIQKKLLQNGAWQAQAVDTSQVVQAFVNKFELKK